VFPLVVLGATVAFAVGLFVYARMKRVSVADWAQSHDPVLSKLLSLNPGIEIEDEFEPVPIYWITNPPSGGKILVPKSEVENARIAFHDCDLQSIPAPLLYPHRTETACLEIRNDEHTLQAFCFRTRNSLQDVVTFYNALLEPSRRFGLGRGVNSWEERREERRRDDGSREFFFSYLLHQKGDLMAFVGYKEQRK
jgi:hypothetical protein